MNELKQHALMLWLIALLVIIKFLLMPIFTWQAQLIADNTYLEKKQQKVANVLNSNNNGEQLAKQLTNTLQQANKMFFPFQTAASFKLTQQKNLEALLSKYELKSQNIGWQVSSLLKKIAVTRYSMQVRFTGKATDVIDFIAALEAQQQRIEINDFNFNIKGQRKKSLGRINGRVTLYFYVNQNITAAADLTANISQVNTQGILL